MNTYIGNRTLGCKLDAHLALRLKLAVAYQLLLEILTLQRLYCHHILLGRECAVSHLCYGFALRFIVFLLA